MLLIILLVGVGLIIWGLRNLQIQRNRIKDEANKPPSCGDMPFERIKVNYSSEELPKALEEFELALSKLEKMEGVSVTDLSSDSKGIRSLKAEFPDGTAFQASILPIWGEDGGTSIVERTS